LFLLHRYITVHGSENVNVHFSGRMIPSTIHEVPLRITGYYVSWVPYWYMKCSVIYYGASLLGSWLEWVCSAKDSEDRLWRSAGSLPPLFTCDESYWDLNVKISGRFPSVLGVVAGDWLRVNSGCLSVCGLWSQQSVNSQCRQQCSTNLCERWSLTLFAPRPLM